MTDVADPHEVDASEELRPEIATNHARFATACFLDKKIRHWRRIAQTSDADMREVAGFHVYAFQEIRQQLTGEKL